MLVFSMFFVLAFFMAYLFLCAFDKKHLAMVKLQSSWEHGSVEDTTPAIHHKLNKSLNPLQGKQRLAALVINENGNEEIITVEVVTSNTVAIRVKGKTITETFCNNQWRNINAMMLSFANKIAKQRGSTTMYSISC